MIIFIKLNNVFFWHFYEYHLKYQDAMLFFVNIIRYYISGLRIRPARKNPDPIVKKNRFGPDKIPTTIFFSLNIKLI